MKFTLSVWTICFLAVLLHFFSGFKDIKGQPVDPYLSSFVLIFFGWMSRELLDKYLNLKGTHRL